MFALLAAATLLPDRPRRGLIDGLVKLERRWGLSALAVVAMFLYWLVRLVFFSDTYLPLIMN